MNVELRDNKLIEAHLVTPKEADLSRLFSLLRLFVVHSL